jgi:hypothetical protein
VRRTLFGSNGPILFRLSPGFGSVPQKSVGRAQPKRPEAPPAISGSRSSLTDRLSGSAEADSSRGERFQALADERALRRERSRPQAFRAMVVRRVDVGPQPHSRPCSNTSRSCLNARRCSPSTCDAIPTHHSQTPTRWPSRSRQGSAGRTVEMISAAMGLEFPHGADPECRSPNL